MKDIKVIYVFFNCNIWHCIQKSDKILSYMDTLGNVTVMQVVFN